MLSGAIKESRLARVRRGLVLIQKGEGGDKGGDSSLYFGWRLEVEEGWRNEAGRVLREQWIVGGGLGKIGCIRRRHVLTIQEWMEEGGDGVVGG
jgi:hypothetical protein